MRGGRGWGMEERGELGSWCAASCGTGKRSYLTSGTAKRSYLARGGGKTSVSADGRPCCLPLNEALSAVIV